MCKPTVTVVKDVVCFINDRKEYFNCLGEQSYIRLSNFLRILNDCGVPSNYFIKICVSVNYTKMLCKIGGVVISIEIHEAIYDIVGKAFTCRMSLNTLDSYLNDFVAPNIIKGE